MKRNLVALLSGALFCAGLSTAGMTRPSKVLAFLDFFGHWDPSLALVMVAAIAVSALAFRASVVLSSPLIEARFHVVPVDRAVEVRVVLGAAIFGVGWGLSGLCPGPAVVSLASAKLGPMVFVASMAAGMALHHAFSSRRAQTHGPTSGSPRAPVPQPRGGGS